MSPEEWESLQSSLAAIGEDLRDLALLQTFDVGLELVNAASRKIETLMRWCEIRRRP